MIYAAYSDPHSGGNLGLINPETKLLKPSDGQEYYPPLTETQTWIWKIYQKLVDAVNFTDDDITLYLLGDPVHGIIWTKELISTPLVDQLMLAKGTLDPWLKLPRLKRIIFVIGTGVHEMGEGSASQILRALISPIRPDVDIVVTYHWLGYDADGNPHTDASHHGSHPGIYLHTGGNISRAKLRDMMQSEINYGVSVGEVRRPPRIYLRGHYHERRDEIVEIAGYKSRLLLLPSMSGITEYARKVGKSPSWITCGGVIFKDESTVDWIIDTKDLRDYGQL